MKLRCDSIGLMSERAPIKAVLVEDGYLFQEPTVEELAKYGVEVEALSTEHEFRMRLPFWGQNPPNVFVLGSWVKWTDPSPDIPTPTQDVVDEDYHRAAGLRMSRYLAEIPELKGVPVIILGFDSDDERFKGIDVGSLSKRELFVDKHNLIDGSLGRIVRSVAIGFNSSFQQ